MSIDDAISVLGLARYKKHLGYSEKGFFTGIRCRYFLGNPAYILEFVEYKEGRVVCILRTPRSTGNLEVELAPLQAPFEF